MKTGIDCDKKTVFLDNRVIHADDRYEASGQKIEFGYGEAIKIMAEWWEFIKSEGINVASEIQMAREKLKTKDEVIT